MTEQGWALSCETQCVLPTRDSLPGHTGGNQGCTCEWLPTPKPRADFHPQGLEASARAHGTRVEMGRAGQVQALSRRPGTSRVTRAQGRVDCPGSSQETPGSPQVEYNITKHSILWSAPARGQWPRAQDF